MSGNKVQEGRINKGRTIDLIRNRPGISRIGASEQLGLNRSTLTHIVNDLLQNGFIREDHTTRSNLKSGRNPIGLFIEEKLILGVEWQDRYLRYSLNNLSGGTLQRDQIDLSSSTYNCFHDQLKDLFKSLTREKKCPIYGLGLALPGQIDTRRGVVLNSKPLGLKDFDLASSLGNSLGIPVLIENDANCFAWGEIAERNEYSGNLLCLLLEFHEEGKEKVWDQEIGIGIVTGGQVYHGSSYSAGELQVSPVEDTARNRFLDSLKKEDTNQFMYAKEYCRQMFFTLQPVISTLDPELVILGGDFFLNRKLMEPFFKKEIFFRWKFSEKGIWEVASGGASFFINTIFSLPGFNHTGIHRAEWEDVLRFKKYGGNYAER